MSNDNIITNSHGKEFDIEALSYLFDQEIVGEQNDLDLAETNQEWFEIYCRLHEERHGATFILDTESPNI